jgi:NADPH-dependent 2,4-dienoyl-CoA reductase/sulfur reductase-like enzyme
LCRDSEERKQHNTSVLLAEVTGIDVQGQRVLMHDQSMPFDYLIVATGASNNYFGHEEWEQFERLCKKVCTLFGKAAPMADLGEPLELLLRALHSLLCEGIREKD